MSSTITSHTWRGQTTKAVTHHTAQCSFSYSKQYNLTGFWFAAIGIIERGRCAPLSSSHLAASLIICRTLTDVSSKDNSSRKIDLSECSQWSKFNLDLRSRIWFLIRRLDVPVSSVGHDLIISGVPVSLSQCVCPLTTKTLSMPKFLVFCANLAAGKVHRVTSGPLL